MLRRPKIEKISCLNALTAVIWTEKLSREKIPPREDILPLWFKNSSIEYIFDRQGTGKSWFTWKMAINISKGKDFGLSKCHMSWKILCVDGEMPKIRCKRDWDCWIRNLRKICIISYKVLNEIILEKAPKMKWNDLNLCESDQQESLFVFFKIKNLQ